MKSLIATLALLAAAPFAYAEESDFHHDVLCKQTRAGSEQASIKITYDRTQHHDLGRIGQIFVELNTGFGDLANIANAIGTEKPYGRNLRQEGAAGQVGNYLIQDPKDPFAVTTVIGFTAMNLLKDDGSVEKGLANFLTHVSLSHVTEHGFFDSNASLETREEVLLDISGGLDGFGHYYERFDVKDCRLLN
jgi:hypothetical protein